MKEKLLKKNFKSTDFSLIFKKIIKYINFQKNKSFERQTFHRN